MRKLVITFWLLSLNIMGYEIMDYYCLSDNPYIHLTAKHAPQLLGTLLQNFMSKTQLTTENWDKIFGQIPNSQSQSNNLYHHTKVEVNWSLEDFIDTLASATMTQLLENIVSNQIILPENLSRQQKNTLIILSYLYAEANVSQLQLQKFCDVLNIWDWWQWGCFILSAIILIISIICYLNYKVNFWIVALVPICICLFLYVGYSYITAPPDPIELSSDVRVIIYPKERLNSMRSVLRMIAGRESVSTMKALYAERGVKMYSRIRKLISALNLGQLIVIGDRFDETSLLDPQAYPNALRHYIQELTYAKLLSLGLAFLRFPDNIHKLELDTEVIRKRFRPDKYQTIPLEWSTKVLLEVMKMKFTKYQSNESITQNKSFEEFFEM